VGGDAALATLSQRDHEAVTAAAMAKVLGVLAKAPTGRGRCGGRCALLCGRLDWDFPRKRLFLSRNIEGRNGRGQGRRGLPDGAVLPLVENDPLLRGAVRMQQMSPSTIVPLTQPCDILAGA
jgi:hypothetical protein